MDTNEAKRQVALAALQMIPEHGVIGLGTGSTAKLFVDEVARLVRAGRRLTGVPTSEQTRSQAIRLGIPLLDDDGPWSIDVVVDGADEVSPQLDAIKGGGGCHTREKIVNDAARVRVMVVDESKLVQHLGERFAIPVEVLRFGHTECAKRLAAFGNVQLRRSGEHPFSSDEGNLIYDVKTGPLNDAAAMDSSLRQIPGVVDTGLFVGRADVVLVAGDDGVRELRRP